MKNYALIAAFAFLSLCTFGQGAKVLNAYNYMMDNELLKAKEEIEPATQHEKTKNDAKTWYYRGRIYEGIYRNSYLKKEDGTDALVYPELQTHREGAVMEAARSYEKAIELGSKKINMNEVKEFHAQLARLCYQEGVEQYNQKDYQEAGDLFMKAYEISSTYGAPDNESLFNAALSYRMAENLEMAEKALRMCIANDFKAIECYIELAAMYREAGQKEKYREVLTEARTKFPDNADLLNEEINVFIEEGEYDKALENLNVAIEKDPTKPALYFARATLLNSKLGEMEDVESEEARNIYKRAEMDYLKAIELKPDYFDALYNLGALYYNRGAEMLNSAASISDDAAYKKAKTAGEEQLKAALPYLEKAHELRPDDVSTMTSLKELYARTNQLEKYNEMNEKLKN
ncbi:MAG: hypothetical protein Kow0075_16510 [Salibacteraceae bacterium]